MARSTMTSGRRCARNSSRKPAAGSEPAQGAHAGTVREDSHRPCGTGKALAKEYKIPDIVAAGIAEHHGDNIIQYFYLAAKEKYPDKEINPDDYRYKGPRPQTREAVILMLADSIEATSRAMADASQEKTCGDGSYDDRRAPRGRSVSDSDLTVKDLDRLENAFR